MRILPAAIVIGPLVLIGALPAAGQSTLALGSGARTGGRLAQDSTPGQVSGGR